MDSELLYNILYIILYIVIIIDMKIYEISKYILNFILFNFFYISKYFVLHINLLHHAEFNNITSKIFCE